MGYQVVIHNKSGRYVAAQALKKPSQQRRIKEGVENDEISTEFLLIISLHPFLLLPSQE